mmetsp:Transcript_14762/g.23258  ORF Transcript_14762/g.23258 Transcript_14762/m.23258 type:complete len:749 (-) Transcript_14762:84-2330(-)
MVLEALVTEYGEETVLVEGDGSTVITSPANEDRSQHFEDTSDDLEPTTPTQKQAKIALSEDTPVPTPEAQAQESREAPETLELQVRGTNGGETCDEEERNSEENAADEDPFERDFDKDPTLLYSLIHKKEWNEAIKHVQGNPEEARIWVSRKEKDGRLRWRLLPVHAAIVFKAPESVVETLLAAYPKGAQSKDDQGMLPLHLAFRTGSSEAIVNILLVACPQSIDVMDRKGRIPLVLAQASTSPNREAFMRALERGPTYYAVAAAATERAAVTAEQRAIFEAKLMQVRQAHEHEFAAMKLEAENKQLELQNKLEDMKQELVKTQETSQVLVDHVNSLEAQLNSRSDTERFLATKIATLDSSLKSSSKTREEIEQKLKTENCQLTLERESLKAKCEELELRYGSVQSRLTQSLDLFEKREIEWSRTEKELSYEVKSMQVEWANAQANCAILDAQLKKKMETEHALATQVSALAGKLAESAAESRDNSNKFVKRIRDLEDERSALRDSVQDLSKRLSLVARLLEDMTAQQSAILDQAKIHEELVESTMSAHAKIVGDAMTQEVNLERARHEREQIRKMLDNQEEQVREGEVQREKMMNAIGVQGQHMASTKKARDQIIASVKSMGADIDGVLKDVLSIIPESVRGEEMVDAVVRNITCPPNEKTTTSTSIAATLEEESAPSNGGCNPGTAQATVEVVPQMAGKFSGEEGAAASSNNLSRGTTAEAEELAAPTKHNPVDDRIMAARGSIAD